MNSKNKCEEYKKALEEVQMDLRCIDEPNEADSYIDDSLRIIGEVLKEG